MFGITSPQIFFQLLVNGILLGAVYAIAVIGLSIIFGTMRISYSLRKERSSSWLPMAA